MIVAQERSTYRSEYFEPNRVKKKRKSRHLVIPSRKKILLAGFVLLSFFLSIFVSFYFANIVKLGYELGNLEKELALLEKENQDLESRIAEISSLESIELVAVQELGMIKPTSENIIFVPVNAAESESFQVITGSQDKNYQGENSIALENTMLHTGQEEKSWIIQAFTDLIARSGKHKPEVESRV